jgi:hypothetical protein
VIKARDGKVAPAEHIQILSPPQFPAHISSRQQKHEQVIMSIAGHVSRAMLSRCSHVRMEAKRRALDEIATRQRTADEKRKQEIERQRLAEMVPPTLVIQ